MNLKMLRIILRLLMVLPFVPLVVSSHWIQVARLNGVNGASHDNFGSSVAISGDTIVVGVPSAKVGGNAYQGQAFVYVKPAGGWSALPTPAATLYLHDGLANQHFGSTVAISGDTIAVGAWGITVNGHTNQGAVHIFTKPVGGWSGSPILSAELTASDGLAND